MKGYIIREKPYKWCLMVVSHVPTKKSDQYPNIEYFGFHRKTDALRYLDIFFKKSDVLYCCLYKKSSIFVRALDKVADFFGKEW